MRSSLRLGAVALAYLGLLGGCASPAAHPPSPSPPMAPRASATAVSSATPAASASAAYAGLGPESVAPEVIARHAPTPLPPAVSRRIQRMLDIRAPGFGLLSNDGKRLFFGWTVTGTAQIWRVDGPRSFPVQLTGGEDPSRLVGLTPDGEWLVVSRDRKGEENPGIYLLSPKGGPLRAVQHKPKVQTRYHFTSDDSKHIYLSANDRKQESYAIYRYEIASGKMDLVFGEDGLWSVHDHQKDGTLLLSKSTGAMSREYWELDPKGKLSPLFGQGELEEYDASYGAAPGELIVRTAKFGDFRRLYRWNRKDFIPITPDEPVDVSSFEIDHPRSHIMYVVNDRGYSKPRALDARTFQPTALPTIPQAERGVYGSTTRDGRYVILGYATAKAPMQSMVLDWKTGKSVSWTLQSSPEVDTSTFVVPSLEYYPARDGTKVPMFVRRPAHCTQPCPVVVHFHGGPEGQSTAGFNVHAQMFVDAGFVFVEPNVRGSDGYGKAWVRADDGAKRLQVISDIEDCALHIRNAWAHEGRQPKIGIMGGSYGGYSTLMGMTRFAGAYDAGVSNVGISNLLSFLQNTAPYRRALRISEYGDPDKDRDTLMQLSPITHLSKIKAPLLLIQGANDPRVPVGEALQVHRALESRGLPTQLIIFPDEGHGAQRRENKVVEVGATIAFFERHLLGK